MDESSHIPDSSRQHPMLKTKSVLEICLLFFDKEIEDLFVEETVRYTREVKTIIVVISIGRNKGNFYYFDYLLL